MTRRAQQGFTLIEVMVSLTILAFMMVIAWSTTYTASTVKQRTELIDERNHELRVGMNRIATDLSSAYLSANEEQNKVEPRTLFKGKAAELRFSSLGHTPMWANANESEQALIIYYIDSDRRNPSQNNLLRRENRRLSDEQWESERGEIDVLLRDVDSIEFEYYDQRDSEWKSRWDTTAADGEKGRLPTRVRYTVTVKTPGGGEREYVSQARIMMQEELRFITN